MKVYVIGQKVDGFGNDEFIYTDTAYEHEPQARDVARSLAMESYIEKLEEIKADIERRIENAKNGIVSSYRTGQYDPEWGSVNQKLFKSRKELYGLDYGEYFILEMEVSKTKGGE